MADPLFEQGFNIFQLLITMLVYAAILVNIFTRHGFDRALFIISLIGYFAILHFVNDFFLATTFVAMWFVLSGTEFFIPKGFLFGVFIILLFLDYSNPLFFLLAIILYIISITNFLFSTFRRIGAKKKSAALGIQ